jgi:aryl carrier-like protein
MTQREDLETGGMALSAGDAGLSADHGQVPTPDESPQGETELTIARVFAEILGRPGLPRTASFFDLGLDSVSVTVACARLEQVTGERVRFSQLFRTPTVAGLAAWVDATRDQLSDGPVTAAAAAASEGAALVAITPMMAETVPTDIVTELAWTFDGEIDEAALEGAASDVHRRHQALHAAYLPAPDLGLAELPADPGRAQFHHLGVEDSDTAAQDALWRTLRQPLRLGAGEVWRCAIVRSRPTGRTLFGAAVHHAAFDGRSAGILAEELSAAYSARAAGTVPRWPGRVASLAEMAADFRHQLAAQDVDAQRRYWRDEFRGLQACHLPGRNDGPAAPGGPATERVFTVPNAQLRIWEDYARAHGMAASVGIGSAYVQAIIRAGGPRDFGLMAAFGNRAGEVIDRSITNRVGNMFLRPNGPSRSGPHLLARMRDAYHQAQAVRDILLDPKEVVGVFSGERSDGVSLRGMPCMVYNQPMPALSLGGVTGTFAPELLDWAKSWLDLVLEVVPGPEGLTMHVVVRTDIYEASLADRLSQDFTDIISDGPERLELETMQ